MKEKFVFVGLHGCLGYFPLEYGSVIELDPEFAQEKILLGNFPLIPASRFRFGMAQAEALVELETFRNPPAEAPEVPAQQITEEK